VIAVVIPDYGSLQLQHLVLDYNGTLALDGRLLPKVAGGLARDLEDPAGGGHPAFLNRLNL
jgi:soluble P-type ATPase